MVGSAVQCVDLVCESGHVILHFLTQGFNNPVSDNSAHTHLHLHLLMFFFYYSDQKGTLPSLQASWASLFKLPNVCPKLRDIIHVSLEASSHLRHCMHINHMKCVYTWVLVCVYVCVTLPPHCLCCVLTADIPTLVLNSIQDCVLI